MEGPTWVWGQLGSASAVPAFVDVAWILLLPGYDLSSGPAGILGAGGCTPELEGIEGLRRSPGAGRLVGSQRASGICLGVVVKGATEAVETRYES